jgi:hypothetical protein
MGDCRLVVGSCLRNVRLIVDSRCSDGCCHRMADVDEDISWLCRRGGYGLRSSMEEIAKVKDNFR